MKRTWMMAAVVVVAGCVPPPPMPDVQFGTTTTTTVTTTQAATLSPADVADVFVQVVRDQSATYSVLTWVDTATDRELRGILDDMCEAYDTGLTIEMVALAFSSGFFDDYEPISVEVDRAQEDMIWYVAGAAFGACGDM